MRKLLTFLYLSFSIWGLIHAQIGSDPNNTQNIITRIVNIEGIDYIAASEFSKNQGIRTSINDKKSKFILHFPNKKIVLSANCSFVKINEIIYQLQSPVLFDGLVFYIPVVSFANIIKLENMPELDLDFSNQLALTSGLRFNILSLIVEKKSNGTLIKIKTTKMFNSDEVAVSFTSGGWMSVTILDGKIDSLGIAGSKISPPVRRVRSSQLSENGQLSFLLQYAVDDHEIFYSASEITISLRTNIAENAEKIKEMRNRWLLDTIVIDAGHGGKDPGAIGKYKIQEKTVTLDIAKKLGKLIRQNLGIKVVFTRDEDAFIPLWKRTKIANDAGGKVFISIHANSVPNSPRAKGFETYLLSPAKTSDAIEIAKLENSVIKYETNNPDSITYAEDIIIATMAQRVFMKESETLASMVQNELSKALPTENRGVKQAGFIVLIGASMPNILVEVGFLSNKKESKLLGHSSYRQKIAKAIYAAIVDFKDRYEGATLGIE